MILKTIAVFLATSLSFFLFYFSVPYGAIGACTNLLFYVIILYLLISGYSRITHVVHSVVTRPPEPAPTKKSPEELAPRLVYLCHGMERDELEVEYMIP